MAALLEMPIGQGTESNLQPIASKECKLSVQQFSTNRVLPESHLSELGSGSLPSGASDEIPDLGPMP